MKLTSYYDDPSFDYKKYWQGREYENQADQIALKNLLALIPKGNRLIDVGAGFGRLTPVYANRFKQCILVDASPKMLEKAKSKLKQKNLKFTQAFVEKLPFKNEAFEAAIMIRTLHHLKNPAHAIKEIARVLKPRGYLILEFANKLHFKAQIKALLNLNLKYLFETKPVKIGPKRNGVVPFVNYPPKQINDILIKRNFEIIKTVSVSNFRSRWLKRIMPLRLLLLLESLAQNLKPPIFTGPSIFILARKKAE